MAAAGAVFQSGEAYEKLVSGCGEVDRQIDGERGVMVTMHSAYRSTVHSD